MKVELENVPKVITGFRIFLLVQAGVCAFLLDFPQGAILSAVVYFVFSYSMKILSVRVKFVSMLTGIPVADLNSAVQQHKAQTAQATQTPATPEQTKQSEQELAAIVARDRQEAVLLKRHWPPQTPAPQNSWLGGLPNLPDGVDWPQNPKTGLALHHLGQIDLAEMPALETCPLPRTGTMWFFADIDEDMCWNEGPENGQSRVLYHPDSTAGQPVRSAPDNLPEVDHQTDIMTGTLWGFRNPKFNVYPRWPVTGHVAGVWAFSDDLPHGVTDRTAYYEASDRAVMQERTAVLGVHADRKSGVGTLNVFQTKTEKTVTADGQPTNKQVTQYLPQADGGHFPYTVKFAQLLLAQIDHQVRADMPSYERNAKRDGASEESRAASERMLAGLKRGAMHVANLDADLQAAAPYAPLSAQTQTAFDALMVDLAARKLGPADWRNIVKSASLSLVAQSMEHPEVLTDIPDAVVAAASDHVLPSHEYTNHYLGGPKGSGGNPTAGDGVRLAQFDSDYGLGMMFCDVGIIDFWIDPDDLAAGRWDRAWAATAGG